MGGSDGRGESATVNFPTEAFAAVVWKYLDLGLAFVGIVVYAQVFPVSGFGAAYTVVAASRIALTVPQGVFIAVKKRTSERVSDARSYLTFGVAFVAVYTVFCTVGAIAVVRLLGIERYDNFVLVGPSLVGARSLFFLVKQLTSGLGTPSTESRLDVVDGVITLAVRIAAGVFAGYGAIVIPAGGAASGVAVAVAALGYRQLVPGGRPTADRLRSVYTYARWDILNRITNAVFDRGPVVFAGAVFGTAAAARLKIGLSLVEPGLALSTAIGATLMVKVSTDRASGTTLDDTVAQSTALSTIAAVPVLLGGVVVGGDLATVAFGDSYTGLTVVLAAVGVYALAEALKRPLTNTAGGVNAPETVTVRNGVRIAASAPVVGIGMVASFQTFLLAWATLGVVDLAVLWVLVGYRGDTPTLWDFGLAWPQVVAGVAMVVVLLPVDRVLSTDQTSGLVAAIAIGATVYLGTVLLVSRRYRGIVLTAVQR